MKAGTLKLVGITAFLIILAMMAAPALLQYATHAVERHGTDAIQTRSLFECGNLPTAEFESRVDNRHLTVCFLREIIKGIQFTDKPRSDPNANELTSFSRGRDLIQWLKNALKDGDFELYKVDGGAPNWLIEWLTSE